MNKKNHINCTFQRRMGAVFYDSLLLMAVLFAATFALMPLTGGIAIDSNNIFYKIFLICIIYLYFCWHWVKGGQTLGMRSWHVYVVDESDAKPGWKQSSARFMFASISILLFGFGFFWSLFDKNKLALHDHLSKTRLVVIKNSD